LETIAVFVLFFTSLLISLYHKVPILYPLLFGLGCFSVVALRRGHTLPALLSLMAGSARKSLIVIKIFVLIGIITAVWRACGTISFIVYYGILFMSAKYFILSAFLLSCLVSFLLGTSFGTVGTIGVVLMVLAKSGGVDINMAAGAIIAGAYFGDRCSPMSSSANLIASLTNTKLYININNMTKTAVIPFALSVIAYLYLSFSQPLAFYNDQIIQEILTSFDISPVVLTPAILILLLAALRVDVKLSMGLSIVTGIVIALVVQQVNVGALAKYIVIGYSMDTDGFFAGIIKGGGLYSMLNVALIVLISSAFAGIFQGAGLLREIEGFFAKLSDKTSVYGTTLASSIATAGFACNQTLAVMLSHQIMNKLYEKKQLSNYRLAVDLENTVILISALIPWNIAGAVPAVMLSADAGFIMYAFYLFLVPLTNLFIQSAITEKQ